VWYTMWVGLHITIKSAIHLL